MVDNMISTVNHGCFMICDGLTKGAPMRTGLNILAVALIVMGSIWILQGINILPGSFMTGQIQWAYRGALAAVVGLVLLAWGIRRR